MKHKWWNAHRNGYPSLGDYDSCQKCGIVKNDKNIDKDTCRGTVKVGPRISGTTFPVADARLPLPVDVSIREELLEVMLHQAVSTISFLHGCLTDPHVDGVPGGYTYCYPEHTTKHLEEFEAVLPDRDICIHSKIYDDCIGCQQGQRARELMAWFRETQ